MVGLRRGLTSGLALLLAVIVIQSGRPAAAQPGSRVALVIGNSAYSNGVAALPNPRNDATAIAETLQRTGFDTFLMLDGSRAEMLTALAAFSDKAKGREAALLFYAGHAVELDGHNLLVAISAHAPDSGAALAHEAVALDEIDRALAGKAASTVIILDSCRDNPFAPAADNGQATRSVGKGVSVSGPGLAAATATRDTLYVYATAPGRIAFDGAGAHSPFTSALLQYLDTAGLEVRDMLLEVRRTVREATGGAQIPWDTSSLERRLYLAGRTPGQVTMTRLATQAAPAASPSAAPTVRTTPPLSGALAALTAVPVAVGPRPHPVCQVSLGRYWVAAVGSGSMTVSRDSEGCSAQLFAKPAMNLPAGQARVREPPRNGRVEVRGNSFAYIPNAGFTGVDRFVIVADGNTTGSLMGTVGVTVK